MSDESWDSRDTFSCSDYGYGWNAYGDDYSDLYGMTESMHTNSDAESDVEIKSEIIDYPLFTTNDKVNQFMNGALSDISIKVNEKTFQLHRAVLWLKSEYFQKIFSSCFKEYKQKELEIKEIEEDTFEYIVKYFYNENLSFLITPKNITSLLKAFDYLGVNVDLNCFVNIISNYKTIGENKVDGSDIFELYNFLQLPTSYSALLDSVIRFFSRNLLKISESNQFLELSFEEFEKILLTRCQYYVEDHADLTEKDLIEVCAKWVSYDEENRSKYMVNITNAINRRYGRSFYSTNSCAPIISSVHKNKEKFFREQLEKILTFTFEFSNDVRNSCETPPAAIPYRDFKAESVREMKNLLSNEEISDITIYVEDETFKLHRIVLASQSEFFYQFFITDERNMQTELQIADIANIDKLNFRTLIKFMYYKEIEITPEHNVVNLLMAVDQLKLSVIHSECQRYIMENLSTINDIFTLYYYLKGETSYKLFSLVEKHILENWTKLHEYKGFHDMSINIIQDIVSSPKLQVSNESDLLTICSKWISYDIETRFQYIPSLMQHICRTFAEEFSCDSKYGILKDRSKEEYVEQKMKHLLNGYSLFSTKNRTIKRGQRIVKPVSVISKEDGLSFFDYKVNKKKLIGVEIDHMKISLEPLYYKIELLRAAIVENVLFVKFKKDNVNYFYAHNMETRRNLSLSKDPEPFSTPYDADTYQLLNCNNKVFLCFRSGKIMKFSPKISRWLTIKSELPKGNIFTSNRRSLYAICTSQPLRVNVYNEFEENWYLLPSIDNLHHSGESPVAACFINGNLLVAFPSFGKLLCLRDEKWSTLYVNSDQKYRNFSEVKQFKNSIIFLNNYDGSELFSYNLGSKAWTKDVNKFDRSIRKGCFVHTIT